MRMVPRLVVIALAIAASIAVAGFAYWYCPRTVEHPSQLEGLLGRRIRMTAVYDGDYKAYKLLHFQGVTLRVEHVTGSYELPKNGQTIYVTGWLERSIHPSGDLTIPYVVRNARWEF